MSAKDYEKDFYAILGVSKDADANAIKKAYRALAKELHPDTAGTRGDPKAEERFKRVSEAYAVLSDPDKRKEYDEARSLFGSGPFRGAGSASSGANLNVDDLLRTMRSGGAPGGPGGGFGDIFGSIFNRTQSGPTGRPGRRGADVETKVSLGFHDALTGATVPLRLTSDAACAACSGTGAKAGTAPRLCATCEGSGQQPRNAGGFAFSDPCIDCRGRGLVVDDPCLVCRGSGRGQSTRTVQTRIPAGVRDGARIRLKGKGAPGENGGPAGDLFVSVSVAPHDIFGRSNDDLTVTVPITFDEAVLGGEVKVPTVEGTTVTVKVAPGTTSGRVLRVRGRGATRRDGTRGDLLVTLDVSVPAKLSGKAREALEAYRAATDDHDPRADLMSRAAKSGPRTEGGATL